MKTQQFSNHVRYYPPHHFIFYPVTGLLLFISIRGVWLDAANRWLWIMIALLAAVTGWLSFMMRQHYALTCQDRLVRLELRLRYYQLTQQRLENIEGRLSFKQLAALRFASDDELVPLMQRTLKEGLSPDAIKQAIKEWLPDTMRV
ncbi:DUF6526 family protein [Agriterribacter sp.]|uniref:DUF6526 family protein n=1 Tax=Agriterribacter sp. TaxID=2821509 RepID=UPI002C9CB0A7|nr:DUF6526 family protein [Agriterribacter sp.]HRP56915.1 DUF6526 family protein [Agriterribacter sp.]